MHRIRFNTLPLLMAVLVLTGWLPPHSEEFKTQDVQDSKTIILVRHAEKCTEPSDNPGLTELGEERARALDRVLTDVDVDVIFSTPLDRTRETVRPLSERSGVSITETPIRAGFLQDMVAEILDLEHQVVVVSGHSNTTPRVVNLLAGTNYDDLEETEYDRLYIVHLPENGMARVTILRYGPPSGPAESAC